MIVSVCRGVGGGCYNTLPSSSQEPPKRDRVTEEEKGESYLKKNGGNE